MEKKKFKVNNSELHNLATGLIGGCALATILVFLSPIFIINEYIEQSKIWLLAAVIHLMTAFVIAFMSIKTRRRNDVLIGLVGVVMWIISTMMIGLAIFDGSIHYIPATVIGCVLGCTIGILGRIKLVKRNNRVGKGRKRK